MNGIAEGQGGIEMKDLTQGSIVSHIVTMAPPIVAGMITIMICQLVDLYFVAGLGDAAIAGAMPKSAFAANAQAKVCAAAVASLLRGETPVQPKLINTCYSLVAPDYGISVAGVYRPNNGLLTDVEGAGGVSPADAPASFHALEATYADNWFQTITTEVFG